MQSSARFTSLIPLYINDLLKNILRSFLNIHANDITVYVRTSKNQDDQNLVVDLSSEYNNSMGKMTCFNASKSMHDQRDDTELSLMMKCCTLDKTPCRGRLFGVKFTFDPK